jgi:hypothetical protein
MLDRNLEFLIRFTPLRMASSMYLTLVSNRVLILQLRGIRPASTGGQQTSSTEQLEDHLWTRGCWTLHLLRVIDVHLDFVRSAKQYTGMEKTQHKHRQKNHGTIKHVCLVINISVQE